MITDLKNRDIATRKPGRPPASEPRQEAQEAIPDMTQLRVPPLICPKCGRGMVPVALGRRKDGGTDCRCSLNGCRFVYTPATVRCT